MTAAFHRPTLLAVTAFAFSACGGRLLVGDEQAKGGAAGTGGALPSGVAGDTGTGGSRAASGGTPGHGGGPEECGGSCVSGTPIGGMPPAGKCMGPAAEPPAAPAEDAVKGPCDIYAEDGGPCVAAHSTVRALYAAYAGPLYQVKKANGATKDIDALTPGGLANSADQDAFCGDAACTISVIYDQSGQGNHLTSAPAGGSKATPDNEADARAVPKTFGGKKVYGLHIAPGVAYRNNNACGTATGDAAETEYMVVAGDVYSAGCCFDYGNVERTSHDNGEGAAEAVYFGANSTWGKGSGDGPWVMGDLENGLWAGDVSPYASNPTLAFKYVTAMLKGDAPGTNHWTIKSGNAQTGELSTPFDGPRPSSRYNPMRKEGAIGLGASGDNSNSAQGNFFEGVMTAHYASSDADDAVQASIVSIYGAP